MKLVGSPMDTVGCSLVCTYVLHTYTYPGRLQHQVKNALHLLKMHLFPIKSFFSKVCFSSATYKYCLTYLTKEYEVQEYKNLSLWPLHKPSELKCGITHDELQYFQFFQSFKRDI